MNACCSGCGFSGVPESFERDDLGAGHRRNRHHAAAQRLAVVVDGARAALREPASEVKPVQAELVAQRVQQRHAGIVGMQDLGLPLTVSLIVVAISSLPSAPGRPPRRVDLHPHVGTGVGVCPSRRCVSATPGWRGSRGNAG
jgi:hypothetical protein